MITCPNINDKQTRRFLDRLMQTFDQQPVNDQEIEQIKTKQFESNNSRERNNVLYMFYNIYDRLNGNIDNDSDVNNLLKNEFGDDVKLVDVSQTQLTSEQRQNIQELKQLEPEYANYSDEVVQGFIKSIYPESKVKDIVWHGTNTSLNLNNSNIKRNFDFSKGIHFDFNFDKAYYWGYNRIPAVVDVRNLFEIKNKEGSDVEYLRERYRDSSYLSALVQGEEYDPNKPDEFFRDGVTIDSGLTETGGKYLNVTSSNQVTILNSPETIEKFKEFVSNQEKSNDNKQKSLFDQDTKLAKNNLSKLQDLINKLDLDVSFTSEEDNSFYENKRVTLAYNKNLLEEWFNNQLQYLNIKTTC